MEVDFGAAIAATGVPSTDEPNITKVGAEMGSAAGQCDPELAQSGLPLAQARALEALHALDEFASPHRWVRNVEE